MAIGNVLGMHVSMWDCQMFLKNMSLLGNSHSHEGNNECSQLGTPCSVMGIHVPFMGNIEFFNWECAVPTCRYLFCYFHTRMCVPTCSHTSGICVSTLHIMWECTLGILGHKFLSSILCSLFGHILSPS
jgi:hypothetical protein